MKKNHLVVLGFFACSAILLPLQAAAHGAHGATGGVSSGASIITSGAQISQGTSLSVQYERRDYKLMDEQRLLDLQGIEDVHQHSRGEALYLSATIGLAQDWDMSFSLPYVRFSGFADNGDAYAQANPGTLSRTDTAKGVGDLNIQTRYRFWQQGDHQVAALMGLKLPSGNIRQKTNQGDILGAHNQPGSGSVDFQLGVAYSSFYQDIAAISADVIGRINTEGAGAFRAGNSLQADLALSFLPRSIIVPFIEFNLLYMDRDIENNAIKKNSGLSSLSLTPGVFVRIGKQQTVYGAISYPLWEELPGIQSEGKYRLLLGYGIGL